MMRLNNQSVSKGLRLALWCTIGGLAVYIVYVLEIPGISWQQERGGIWATGLAAFIGSIIPILVMGIAELRQWITSKSERYWG